MDGRIDDVAELEACIGRTPGPMSLKVIDHLDAGALRWLASSPLMFAGFSSRDAVAASLGGGRPGFVETAGGTRMRIPTASMDDPESARVGAGFGSLFIIPTIGETLRVNGHVTATDGEGIEVEIEECYVHCAKALIRSEFWKADPEPEVPVEPGAFLEASRFIALATADTLQHTDVSPKGDPAGKLIRLEQGAVSFADRPGNRRADSFRNMLSQTRVAIIALIPGATRVVLLRGEASLETDERMRKDFAVQEKTPLLATRVEPTEIRIVDSPALARARLWPAEPPRDVIDPAAILVGHVKLSKERGLQASLVRSAVSVPGVMRKGLERDYKTNLY